MPDKKNNAPQTHQSRGPQTIDECLAAAEILYPPPAASDNSAAANAAAPGPEQPNE